MKTFFFFPAGKVRWYTFFSSAKQNKNGDWKQHSWKLVNYWTSLILLRCQRNMDSKSMPFYIKKSLLPWNISELCGLKVVKFFVYFVLVNFSFCNFNLYHFRNVYFIYSTLKKWPIWSLYAKFNTRKFLIQIYSYIFN